MERGETPEVGMRREIMEEVGIQLDAVDYLGSYFNSREYKQDTVYCFYAQVLNDAFMIDSFEIEEARWFPRTELPVFFSSSLPKVLAMYLEKMAMRSAG